MYCVRYAANLPFPLLFNGTICKKCHTEETNSKTGFSDSSSHSYLNVRHHTWPFHIVFKSVLLHGTGQRGALAAERFAGKMLARVAPHIQLWSRLASSVGLDHHFTNMWLVYDIQKQKELGRQGNALEVQNDLSWIQIELVLLGIPKPSQETFPHSVEHLLKPVCVLLQSAFVSANSHSVHESALHS